MGFNLLLKDEALLDLQEAYDWYESNKPGLGLRFLDYVDLHFQKIMLNPNRFPTSGGQRELIMTTFPFKIVFFVDETSIIVLGVLHQKRNPDTITGRST